MHRAFALLGLLRRRGRAFAAALAFLAACGPEPPTVASPAPAPASAGAPEGKPAPPGLIAFARQGNLWTMNADGSGARAVTSLKDARASDPAWSPDRRLLAFAAAGRDDLLSRNLFVVGADGSGLRQVTPMPRAGLSQEDAPKGTVQGRAVFVDVNGKRPVSGLPVTVYGIRRDARTDAEGRFRSFMPAGGGWLKIAGTFEERPVISSTFAAIVEGKTTDLGDVVLRPGASDAAAAPAWSADGSALYYQLRHGRLDPTGLSPSVSIRRIRSDGRNDETFYAPSRATILSGPVLRKGRASIKTSDGRVLTLDLQTKSPRASAEVGFALPDVLAVSPDGALAVTLRGDDLVVVRGDAAESIAAFAKEDPRPRALDFSPDGARLVTDRWAADGKSDLWLFDLASRRFSRLTEDGASSSPVWHGR